MRQQEKCPAVFFYTLVNPPLTAAIFAAYNYFMMQIYALYGAILGLFLCNIAAFWAALRVGARVTKLKDSMPADLDWEQVAKLTGDVAGLKRQITAKNNRMNGFESSKGRAIDAQAAVQALAQQQTAKPNVSYLGG